MGRALSRRMLRAIFFKMKLKGIARKPKPPVTLEDLARAYKLPKTQATAPAKPLKISKRPSRGRRAKGSRRKKQEIIIKVETPKSTVPENPRRRTPKPKTETPQLEGAAKESETKTRTERLINALLFPLLSRISESGGPVERRRKGECFRWLRQNI